MRIVQRIDHHAHQPGPVRIHHPRREVRPVAQLPDRLQHLTFHRAADPALAGERVRNRALGDTEVIGYIRDRDTVSHLPPFRFIKLV